ncbi:hypothetical protein [Lysinibacillus sp. Ag94]|uniref:hypothetical protein n=1 Tax=Lysinibacillus sp. Ag94 TaxID=2936682 RepID=UPI00200FDB68|nr:hypothetical protein [Lysinibacillus sp. Ag94]UPW84253.1 hypothetical protein MY533_05110 [Lysinibacillus sp. Ag94]
MKWLIGEEAGRLLGDSDRGTRVKRLIGRPKEALLCAKAKRQLQSAQSEWKSNPRFVEESFFIMTL